jgi:hypothetical protein
MHTRRFAADTQHTKRAPYPQADILSFTYRFINISNKGASDSLFMIYFDLVDWRIQTGWAVCI